MTVADELREKVLLTLGLLAQDPLVRKFSVTKQETDYLMDIQFRSAQIEVGLHITYNLIGGTK